MVGETINGNLPQILLFAMILPALYVSALRKHLLKVLSVQYLGLLCGWYHILEHAA